MKKVFGGFAVGVLIAALFAIGYSGVLKVSVDRQLIEDWRKIQPGMTVDRVQQVLGKPNGQFPLGDEFPRWACSSVPEGYHLNHGLTSYVISGIGPQVLLIYFDQKNQVTYVASIST